MRRRENLATGDPARTERLFSSLLAELPEPAPSDSHNPLNASTRCFKGKRRLGEINRSRKNLDARRRIIESSAWHRSSRRPVQNNLHKHNCDSGLGWAGYEDCSGAAGEEKLSLLQEFSSNSAPGLTAFTDAILGGFQEIGKRNESIHPIGILKSDLRRLGNAYSPSSSGFSGAATDATGVIPFSSSARLNAGISLSRRF